MANEKCPDCNGSGKIKNENAATCDPQYIDCPRCGGTGVIAAWKLQPIAKLIEGLDASVSVAEALSKAKITTVGELDEALRKGERFGLNDDTIEDLKEIVEEVADIQTKPQ